jgi:hypothetical protein
VPDAAFAFSENDWRREPDQVDCRRTDLAFDARLASKSIEKPAAAFNESL